MGPFLGFCVLESLQPKSKNPIQDFRLTCHMQKNDSIGNY